MACLLQFSNVPAAYAVVAGGCDWPLPPAVGLSNIDVIAFRPLRQFRYVPYVSYVACVACAVLDGNPVTSPRGALGGRPAPCCDWCPPDEKSAGMFKALKQRKNMNS